MTTLASEFVAWAGLAHGTMRKARTFVEFLAPLRGRGHKGLLKGQPGLRAEALRYLHLLAFEPLVLHASDVRELGVETASRPRVPQPALYVAQKILARRSGRRPDKLGIATAVTDARNMASIRLWLIQRSKWVHEERGVRQAAR
jgi:hypothetical protein